MRLHTDNVTLFDEKRGPWVTVLGARCSKHFAIHNRDQIPDMYNRFARRWRIVHRKTGASVGALPTLAKARQFVEAIEALDADAWESSDILDYRCKCNGCKSKGIGAYMSARVRSILSDVIYGYQKAVISCSAVHTSEK